MAKHQSNQLLRRHPCTHFFFAFTTCLRALEMPSHLPASVAETVRPERSIPSRRQRSNIQHCVSLPGISRWRGTGPAIGRLKTTMRTLGKIVLGLATFAMLWPASQLMIASLKRTEPPSKIIAQAIACIVVMFVISRVYRKL